MVGEREGDVGGVYVGWTVWRCVLDRAAMTRWGKRGV